MYEAEIEEIDGENSTAAVTFAGYGNAEVIPLQNLKPSEEGRHSDDEGMGKPKSRYENTGHLSISNCPVIRDSSKCHPLLNAWFSVLYVPRQEGADCGAEGVQEEEGSEEGAEDEGAGAGEGGSEVEMAAV